MLQLKTALSRVEDEDEVRIVNLKANTEYQLADAFDIPDQENVVVVLITGDGQKIKSDRRRLFEW